MPALTSHRGEMTQGLFVERKHRSGVKDPVAERTRRAYQRLDASAVGLEFGAAVLIGLFLGYWLDEKFGTAPWLLVLFVAFGFAAGVKAIVSGVKRAERAQREEEERHGE